MWSVQRVVFVALAGACLAWPGTVAFSTGVMTPKQAALQGLVATKKVREQRVDKLIVRLRPTEFENEPQIRNSRVQALSIVAGAQLKSLRRLASGSHLLQLDRAMTVAEARAMSARLVREGDVEYAEPDILFKKVAVPNEVRFAQWQWNLFAPTSSYSSGGVTTTTAGGANLPPAWDLTQGSEKVTIAIIDTGITNHQDLNGIRGGAVYTPAGRFLPGYDFVSSDIGTGLPSNFIANDGNGRDSDPTDPGDWITEDDAKNHPTDCDDGSGQPSTSSWHGTHMAGTAAATANNAEGIAGVGWNVRILPVRALGKCGGSLSDIADAIRWAAGAQPKNGQTWEQNGVTIGRNVTNKAQIISLSLGGDTVCSPEMQGAVDAAIAEGALVVAATGNDGVEGLISPAICSGVVAVTAHAINGENADYANIGAGTTLSAPGGGQPVQLGRGSPIDDNGFNGYYIHSTVQFGDTTPTSTDSSGNSGPAYAGFVGTSPATPHAAGVAALIKSISPDATPAQIKSFLQSTTRPYPAGSACVTEPTFAGKCGSGLLDAERALLAVPDAIPAAIAGPDQVVTPGTVVTLDGSKSRALSGKTLTAYEWTQTTGTTVTLATPNAAVTTFTAPASGSLTFRLRVTDSQAKVGDDFITVHVNNTPVLAAAPPAQSVPSGGIVSFAVTGSDADGDALTYVASALSSVPLSALSPSGQFTWNTAGIPPGSYQLIYFVTDGVSQSATQTVQIAVTAANLGSSGGGGGALPWLQLLLLAALLAAPAIRQRKR